MSDKYFEMYCLDTVYDSTTSKSCSENCREKNVTLSIVAYNVAINYLTLFLMEGFQQMRANLYEIMQMKSVNSK